MNCPICGQETEHETDYLEYTLMESHDRCPTGHWGRDYVTGSEGEWFKVDDRTFVDYVTSDGGVLCMAADDGVFNEVRKLTSDDVNGYLYTAKRLYEHAAATN